MNRHPFFVLWNWFIASTVFLYSCTQPVSFDLPELPPQLVINGLLDPAEEISVYISHTTFAGDTLANWIEDAQVDIWEEGQWVASLTYCGAGKYCSFLKPKIDKLYKVTVQAPAYELVWAEDRIPIPVQPYDSDFYLGTSAGETNTYWGLMALRFQDEADFENYYELTINPYLSDVIITDPAWIAEEDEAYQPTSLFFSDLLFDGEAYAFQWKSKVTRRPKLSGNGYWPIETRSIQLRTTSKHYYRYRKSWTRHRFNQGPGFTNFALSDLYELWLIGDPTEVYTNVEGGLGIFAAYHIQTVSLVFIE